MQAAVKYAVDAVNYLIDAAGSSLLTEIYYLRQVQVTCNMRATFNRLAQEWGSREPKTTSTSSLPPMLREGSEYGFDHKLASAADSILTGWLRELVEIAILVLAVVVHLLIRYIAKD